MQALFPEKSPALSHRWDKSQLVHVLSKWLECARSTHFSLQTGILLDICVLKDGKGKTRIGHTLVMPSRVFLDQDDGSVSAFSISTPQKSPPVANASQTEDQLLASLTPVALSQPPNSVPETPNSTSKFLKELGEVTDLAATFDDPVTVSNGTISESPQATFSSLESESAKRSDGPSQPSPESISEEETSSSPPIPPNAGDKNREITKGSKGLLCFSLLLQFCNSL